MRVRFWGTVFAAILCAGMVAAGDRKDTVDKQVAQDNEFRRTVTLQDCSFQKDPDSFTTGLRRSMEEISERTDRFVRARRIGAQGSSQTFQSKSPFAEDIPSRGYIDDHIFGKMRQDAIPHADLSPDADFLRRVTLDLTGRVPAAAEVRAFLTNDSPRKRSDLIASLLNSSEFVDRWTMYYGDLLRNTSTDSFITRYAEGRNAFYRFIKYSLENGMPYDVFVKKILTSSGDTWNVPEGNWSIGAFTPMGPTQDTYDQLTVRAATQFLGLANMDCLLCHSGPGHLDKVNLWGAGVQRSQAWQMSAFFSRYRFTRSASQNTTNSLYYWTITDATSGDYTLNTTSGNRPPRQPSGTASTVQPRYLFSTNQANGATYREKFANNLIADRQFARATVNYLWKEMMGVGIVEPADQFDLARLDPSKPMPDGWALQPSHPELLEALTDDFIRSGFNIRYLLGLIADSNAYQLSTQFPGDWKVEYTAYYARKFVRRLSAEEAHDAITKATGVPGSYTVQGFDAPVQWAMQLPETAGTNGGGEPRSRGDVATFLNYFLRGNRDQDPRSGEATVFQALNMMNSSFVLSRIRSTTANSTVSRLLADKNLTDAKLIEELYLTFLSRFPNSQEARSAKTALQANRATGTENLAWALLNKIDFLYNY